LPRRPASTLTNAEVTKLRDAYKAMRALTTSDPSDPRGFQHQANVHCWYCGEGTQIHFSWQFFVWHRAYLYFHERILGRLVGDMNLRLPYWSWENTSHRHLPPAYATPADASNPLWNGTRAMSATDSLPDEDVGHDVMEAALTAGTFGEFGGTATDNGIPEMAPHGSVHVDVGGSGDMGAFSTAARDPVFFAHHANIDKMWSDWNKSSSAHANPTTSDFLNLSWNFYDENKVWRSITAAQVLNHENQLRYKYGPSLLVENLPCLIEWLPIPTDWRASLRPSPKIAPSSKAARLLAQGNRIRLHLSDVQVPLEHSAVYRLYATAAAAREDRGTGSPGYLGTIPVVVSDREGRHAHSPTRDVTVTISRQKLDLLAKQEGSTGLSLVERRRGGAAKAVLPVRARDVQFSVADREPEQ